MDGTRHKNNQNRTRRELLAMAMTAVAVGGLRRVNGQEEAAVDPDLDPASAAELESVQRAAEAAGLDGVRARVGPTYLVVGDAQEPFLQRALVICEALARDYLAHFTRRRFTVHRPERRLTVVALSGPEAFAAYLGTPQDEAVGGQYDLETNRLIMFDNRARPGAGPLVERANTVALMHEAAHQLTFNTGLLERGAEIPLAIHEGLGTYAETRRPDGRVPIGRPNEGRLAVLVEAVRRGRLWLAAAELFGDDALLVNPEVVQQAYAQSWLLVYHLLQNSNRLPQFRAYLASLKRPSSGQVPDRQQAAEAAFGDLSRLDRELQSTLTRLVRGSK